MLPSIPHQHEEDVTVFAETNFRNHRQRFGIRRRDRRSHCFVLGKTGTGKSTLLETCIVSDIHAGESVILLDPHGELAERVLAQVPLNRRDDVVYFDPASNDQSVGFNVLEQKAGVHIHLIAAGLITVLKKIWKDSWGPRMEYILRNIILALLELPETTLADIPRMLTDIPFRASVIARVTDHHVKDFWLKEYEKYPLHFRAEAIAPIQNKIGQFLTNTFIRTIVAQPHSAFDMGDIMNSGKILIANLSKGRIGEDASSLLGALLLTQIEIETLRRANTQYRKDTFVYIDEVHAFISARFGTVLSEARKYHTSYILAIQYLDQLDPELRNSIFGNCGSLLCFRIGARDAEYMVKEFYLDVDMQSLLNLPNHHIYLKLMIDGMTSRAFSATTLPPQHQQLPDNGEPYTARVT